VGVMSHPVASFARVSFGIKIEEGKAKARRRLRNVLPLLNASNLRWERVSAVREIVPS